MSNQPAVEQAHTEFFAEAGGAVTQMAGQVRELADRFRKHDLTEANAGLNLLAAELKDFVAMIGVLQGPLGIPAERLTVDGLHPDEQIARLGTWLESMIVAQDNQDWLTVADILEYDLEPVLNGWSNVLQDCAAG